MSKTKPVFAADQTFRRLHEAGILAEARSTGSIVIEVICGNWKVRVRGCAGEPRQWFTVEVAWEDVQLDVNNPLIDAVDRVVTHLTPLDKKAAPPHAVPITKAGCAPSAETSPGGCHVTAPP